MGQTPFAERKLRNIEPEFLRHYQSGLILAVRITLPHFSVSSPISFPKSAGEPASRGAPSRQVAT